MRLRCNVVDVGARYGLHPTWEDLRDVVSLYLFEMDTKEARRLKRKYVSSRNITIYPYALYSSDCKIKYKVRCHQGLSSLFDNDTTVRKSKNFLIKEAAIVSKKTAQARAIDPFFEDKEIHFLKIDAEGAELEVLKGAQLHLDSSVLGIRMETYFVPVNRNMPLFGDIHTFLKKYKFELINFDYDGRGHALSKFTLPYKYGQFIASESVWVKDIKEIFKQKKNKIASDVIVLALFLMNNHATDIALSILLKAKSRKGVNFTVFKNDPIFRTLKRKVAFLFKDMLSLPSVNTKEIYSTYKKIFGEAFPVMNKFYETFSL
ncbi:FkbM family methyltransferase [Candidatus Omnitrophota bacterium]